MQVAAPARVHSNCLGFALIGAPGEPHATIIYSRILGLAHDTGVDNSFVLGIAIAHEVGHLLLQSTEHSTDLMAPLRVRLGIPHALWHLPSHDR